MNNQVLPEKFRNNFNKIKEKILQRGGQPHISVKEQIRYLEELASFQLGQVLIEKKYIDTFWTDFIISNTDFRSTIELEDFIFNRSPFTLSWRELLTNFQAFVQNNLKENIILASIPCGAMKELLELDYSGISNFKIMGIDIDPSSLSLAKQNSEHRGFSKHLQLFQYDAWNLSFKGEIDLITSCGLNIYVSNPQKVKELYREFFKCLKIGGTLVVSFLTHPPYKCKSSEWRIENISERDLYLEEIIYKDILELECQNFRTSKEIEQELIDSGFSEVTFFYDKLRVFPMAIAKKCSK